MALQWQAVMASAIPGIKLYFPRGVCVNSKGEVYVAVGGDEEPGHGE